MKGLLHFSGRGLQLLALLVLPSAIWSAEMTRSEALSIGLFVASVVIFFAGYALTRVSVRL
jgi:hypothetical protein